MLTIGIIGQVSAGKSSFINSLFGAYVSTAALSRDTYRILEYRTGAVDNSIEITRELAKVRNANLDGSNKIDKEILNAFRDLTLRPHWSSARFRLLDFPGFNDSNDASGDFLRLVLDNLAQIDILIYVTSAQTAFLQTSETLLYGKIAASVKEQESRGIFTRMVVVVNKYDDRDDEELESVFKAIKLAEDVKLFKYSSHRAILHAALKCNRNNLHIPEMMKADARKLLKVSGIIDRELTNVDLKKYESIIETGDWDNLLGWINNYLCESLNYQFGRLCEMINRYNWDEYYNETEPLIDNWIKLYCDEKYSLIRKGNEIEQMIIKAIISDNLDRFAHADLIKCCGKYIFAIAKQLILVEHKYDKLSYILMSHFDLLNEDEIFVLLKKRYIWDLDYYEDYDDYISDAECITILDNRGFSHTYKDIGSDKYIVHEDYGGSSYETKYTLDESNFGKEIRRCERCRHITQIQKCLGESVWHKGKNEFINKVVAKYPWVEYARMPLKELRIKWSEDDIDFTKIPNKKIKGILHRWIVWGLKSLNDNIRISDHTSGDSESFRLCNHMFI